MKIRSKKILIFGIVIVLSIGLLFSMIPGSGSHNIGNSNKESNFTTAWDGYYSSYTFRVYVNNSSFQYPFTIPVNVTLFNYNTGNGTTYNGYWTFTPGLDTINAESFVKNGFPNPFTTENSIYIYTSNMLLSFQVSSPNAFFTVNENGIPYSLFGGVLIELFGINQMPASDYGYNGTAGGATFYDVHSVANELSLSFQASSTGYNEINDLTVYSQVYITKNGITNFEQIQTEPFTGSISFFVPKGSKIQYETLIFQNGAIFLKKSGNITMGSQSKTIFLNITSQSKSFIGVPLVDISGSISLFLGTIGGYFLLKRSDSLVFGLIPMGLSLFIFYFVGWLPLWILEVYGGFSLVSLFIFRDNQKVIIPGGSS